MLRFRLGEKSETVAVKTSVMFSSEGSSIVTLATSAVPEAAETTAAIALPMWVAVLVVAAFSSHVSSCVQLLRFFFQSSFRNVFFGS